MEYRVDSEWKQHADAMQEKRICTMTYKYAPTLRSRGRTRSRWKDNFNFETLE